MNNNTVKTNPFGFSVSLTNITQVTNNVWTSSATNPILNGSQGAVTQLEFNNGATLTLNSTANPNVQGLIWKSGVTQNSSNVMAASSKYGNGRVFIVTDSSPMDDGTGSRRKDFICKLEQIQPCQTFYECLTLASKIAISITVNNLKG